MEFNTKSELQEHMNELVEKGYLKLANIVSEDGKSMVTAFIPRFDDLSE